MRTQTQHVLQKLFSEDSIENVSEEQLRRLVEEHPYFTLGHLLLAQKLQTIGAEEYEAQSERASLYFNEPIWLQSLLHPGNETNVVPRQPIEHGENQPQEEAKEERQLVVEEVVLIEEVNEEELYPPPPPPPPPPPQDNGSQHHVDAVPTDDSQPVDEEEEEQTSVNDTTPIFEPYHTVDYFASQGIKVSNEIKPNDRLGQQLKSFTEWLKTMKRLPETKVESQLDEVTQQNIQEFAAHSLDQKEVITETMAEVLIQQHKQHEAVAIYEKLSLLNPSKRAYFAAKIDQLKGS